MVLTESRSGLSINRRLQLPADVIVQTLWVERYKLLLSVLLTTLVGIVVALWITPEFRSEARLMPEMNNGSGDILKRLASVAGFSGLDFSDVEEMDAIRPDLYPNVLQSTPFLLYLIDQPVSTTDGLRLRLGQFLMPDTKRWPMRQLLSFSTPEQVRSASVNKPEGTVRLSVRQQELVEEISERVSAKFDTRSGIITITATMPDAIVAATVAQLSMKYLMQYVSRYRVGKAQQDLSFYNRQLVDARKRYHKAQFAVFNYNEQHKHVVMLSTTVDRQLLDAELAIAQTVYTELSRQLEQSKLKVQAQTPVFTVLEPPKVPLKRISPKRTVLVLLSATFGLMLGTVYILARKANLIGQLQAMVTVDSLHAKNQTQLL